MLTAVPILMNVRLAAPVKWFYFHCPFQKGASSKEVKTALMADVSSAAYSTFGNMQGPIA